MKKKYFIVIIFVCVCILGLTGLILIKQNKETKKAGVLSHEEYYYDETGGTMEDEETEDGLTPIRTDTYEPVEVK